MEPNQIVRENDKIMWHQVVRNKSDLTLVERNVLLRDDLYQLVDEYAEFCADSRGDRYRSIGAAMNDINAQSKELLEKVYAADRVEDVESYGSILNAAIKLYKTIEQYYFSEFGLRTGTGGD